MTNDKTEKHNCGSCHAANVMIENSPYAMVLFDARMRVIDCNSEAVSLFGISSREELIKGFDLLINQIIPQFQPDGENSKSKMKNMINEAVRSGRAVFNFTYTFASGEDLPVEITMVRAEWNDSYAVSCYIRDLRTFVETRNELSLHSRLLEAVNDVATELAATNPDTFGGAVREALRIIGQAAGVDRTYVWNNFTVDEKTYVRQLFEWTDCVEPQQGKEFTISVDYDDIPNWKEIVFSGKILNGPVKEVAEPEHSALEMQSIKSILIIPISFNNQPWGFIGFDDCHNERVFGTAMEQVLQSVGILIVSAIIRNETTMRLVNAKIELLKQEKLLRAVNKTASLLMGSDRDEFNDAVRQALMTLGMCTEAKRVAIWRNDENDPSSPRSFCIGKWEIDSEGGVENDNKMPDMIMNFKDHLPSWKNFKEDLFLFYDDLDKTFVEFEALKEYKSFLLLPIIIHGKFWGFMSFSYKEDDNSLSDSEKNILRSGGMLVAFAIIKSEINENLVVARENALASTRAKTEFLSRMSHEIRTPMNAIISMTSLARKCGEMKRVQHYLETVDSASQQLLSIINDVLDMSKIDANKLEINYSEFDFEKVLKHVFNVIQVKIEEKNQTLILDFPQIFCRNIISDELRLSQVLINLIGNAVKFTPEYGEITLKVRESKIDADRSLLRLEINDNGIGINPELLQSVFKSFEQGDGGITRQYGGTGLGLAICKQIINLMGGEIWAESELGKGSSFILEINVGWGGERTDASYAGSLRSDLRILVVDDNPDVLEYFTNVFEGFSLSCDIAGDGFEAVRMMSEKTNAGTPYDIIFLDWYMPEMNGGEVAQKIREITKGNTIVVMISSADWKEIEHNPGMKGIRYFLQKPVLSSDLYNILIKLTGTSSERHEDLSDDFTDWSAKHILLAEDVDVNIEIVTAILEGTGVKIDIAKNGREAVNMYTGAPSKYDLILMDVQMPILDGISATGEIRNSNVEGAKSIPIVAMTANAFKEDEKASFEAGMSGHLAKPIDIPAMMKLLKKWLG